MPPRVSKVRRRRVWLVRCVGLLLLAGLAWWAADYARLHLTIAAASRLLRESHPSDAAIRLEAALRQAPECAEAEYLLAVAHRRSERLQHVEEHLRAAQKLGWDAKAIKRQRYLTMFQAGDYLRAGPYVKRLLTEGGTNDEAEEVYEAMIRGYFAALLFREASFLIDAWCHWQPQNPAPYLLRAQGAMLVADFNGEVAVYRDILRFAPTHYETRQRLAEALLVTHQFHESLVFFRDLAAERGDDATNLLGLADCLNRHGQVDEAEAQIAAALRLPLIDRQRAFLTALQGRMAMSKREFARAADFFSEAFNNEPGNSEIAYALSQSLRRAGRTAEAEQSRARYHELRQIDERLDEVRADLVQRPDDAELRCQIGMLMLEKDAHDPGGLNWLLSALLRDPGHRKAHHAAAQYYRAAGQPELADKHIAAARASANQVQGSQVQGSRNTLGVIVVDELAE